MHYSPCNSRGWVQASVPLRRGGLGYTSAASIVEAAYTAFVVDSFGLISESLASSGLGNLEEAVHAAVSLITSACPQPPAPITATALFARALGPVAGERLQSVLTDEIQQRVAGAFYSSASRADLVHLRSCSTLSSCVPFVALPDPHSGTYLRPEPWRTTIALRLGQNIFSGNEPCPVCARRGDSAAAVIEKDGRHALICVFDDGSTRSHNVLRDYLRDRVFKKLGITALREVPLPRTSHASNPLALKMDLVVPGAYALSDADLSLDVTVAYPDTATNIAQAAGTGGGAASLAERTKHVRYDVICRQEAMELVPIGLDIYGALGAEGDRFFRRLGAFSSSRNGRKTSDEHLTLTAAFVVKLQSMQARQISTRRPTLSTSV